MKIRTVGAELFHEDGQTDMTKLTVAFRNFVNAPPKYTAHMKLQFTTECPCFCPPKRNPVHQSCNLKIATF